VTKLEHFLCKNVCRFPVSMRWLLWFHRSVFLSFFEVFLSADLWVCFLRASCQRSQDGDLPQGE